MLCPRKALQKSQFQSTHPVRGATHCLRLSEETRKISIHAPRAGCDAERYSNIQLDGLFQSTHPVRGATTSRSWTRALTRYFNPRTPCGVRLSRRHTALPRWRFQSTHPVRGATRRLSQQHCASWDYFNPRTPCGVRLANCGGMDSLDDQISIHAPRAGCDLLPCVRESRRYCISIHAPRAGCDLI